MKKLLKVLLTALVLCSAMTVSAFAEGSPRLEPSVVNWSAEDVDGNPIDLEKYELVFLPITEQNLIDVNEGTVSISDYLKGVNVLPGNTSKVGMFTDILNLVVRDKATHDIIKVYNLTVTIEVPSLVEGQGTVTFYHCGTNADGSSRHELITPSSVDYTNKTITVTIKDLSPVAVLYTQTAQKPVDTATTVNYTGIFALVAIAAGALLVATKKKTVA